MVHLTPFERNFRRRLARRYRQEVENPDPDTALRNVLGEDLYNKAKEYGLISEEEK